MKEPVYIPIEGEAYVLLEELQQFIQEWKHKGERRFLVEADLERSWTKRLHELIDRLIAYLIEEKENFFGYFLLPLGREIRFDLASPTGITFKKGHYVLLLNPLLFLTLSSEQMACSFKHEVMHILSLHVLRLKEWKKNYSKLALNLAMDVTINNYLSPLPTDAINLPLVNLRFRLSMPPYQTLDYYVEKIQGALDLEAEEKGQEQDLKAGEKEEFESFFTAFDAAHTHDSWEEGDVIEEKTLFSLTERSIIEAYKGDAEGFVKALIAEVRQEPSDMPWHWYLKKLLGTVVRGKKKTSFRRHRRQPERLDLRGNLRHHKAKVVVALDSSGSMTDEVFLEALREVLHLVHAHQEKITVLECDESILRSYEVYSDKDIKPRLQERRGTRFTPVIEYCNREKADLLIYFTDGKGEKRLERRPLGYSLLWVLVGEKENLSLEESYGLVKTIRLDKKDSEEDVDLPERGGFSMANQERFGAEKL